MNRVIRYGDSDIKDGAKLNSPQKLYHRPRSTRFLRNSSAEGTRVLAWPHHYALTSWRLCSRRILTRHCTILVTSQLLGGWITCRWPHPPSHIRSLHKHRTRTHALPWGPVREKSRITANSVLQHKFCEELRCLLPLKHFSLYGKVRKNYIIQFNDPLAHNFNRYSFLIRSVLQNITSKLCTPAMFVTVNTFSHKICTVSILNDLNTKPHTLKSNSRFVMTSIDFAWPPRFFFSF
jgi:hypothetical protein